MDNITDILSQLKVVEDEKIKQKTTHEGDFLQLKKDCTYYGRIVPNMAKVADTFVTWEEIGFMSKTSAKKYISAGRAPRDMNVQKDIWSKIQWDEYTKYKEAGDTAAMESTYALIPKRKQAVNFYLHKVVGKDDDAKGKIGTVVKLRYPAQINNKTKLPSSAIYLKIHNALYDPERSKKIGGRAFDLGPNGRSLVVRVTEKKNYNNYDESEFDEAEDLGLSAEEIKTITASAHDLTESIPALKSQEELKDLLDEHWFGVDANSEDNLDDDDVKNTVVGREDEEEEAVKPKVKTTVEAKAEVKAEAKVKEKAAKPAVKEEKPSDDDLDVDDILADLA